MSVPSVFDKLGRRPKVAEMLDWTLLGFNIEEKWVKLSFEADDRYANPAGFVHGGILVCMLDETMGSSILCITDAKFAPATISLTADYLRPARCGRILAEGKVTSLGKSIAFAEATLTGADGKSVARATASFRLTAFDAGTVVAA